MTVSIDAYRQDFETAIEEVHQLHLLRYVWKNIFAMLESKPDLEHHWLVNNYLATTYTRTLAIGIRRQSDTSESRATIGSLLRRVGAHVEDFTAASLEFESLDI